MSDPFDFADMPAEAGPSTPPAAAQAAYLQDLNPPQKAAVEHGDGALLVLAGAGTGKTRVLTTRLAHMLLTGQAWPSQILAVTFTNKAAREMRDRVTRLIGGAAEGLWLGTFHSLGARILRRHAELIGLKSNFTILDTDDQLRLLKQIIQAENIDEKRWPARSLLAIVQRWKDKGLTPDKVPAADVGEFAAGRAVTLYRAYQERLADLNAADFGDLLLHCLTLFGGHPDVLADYQRRFKFILVDEYQDTNVAQYLWLRLLAQTHQNICCVGDEDQSIYGWRGAEVGNILRFETDFPGATVVRLEQNYRSSGHILATASSLIAKNESRLGKTLWTTAGEGEPVRVNGVWDGQEEARAIGDEIEALQRKKHSLSEIAILVRAGFQTREFEERFITLGLPYRVVGGMKFYERQEIRDAIAYLRVVHQPSDDLAFERIVNTPRRGIGAATMRTVHELARRNGLALTASARQLAETDELKPQARRQLAALLEDFTRWRVLAEAAPPGELAETVLDESGYTEMWRRDKSVEAPGRLENLRELIGALEEFDVLGGFLEHVSLVMDADDVAGSDMVNVMTLHSAKGLEFDTVFLPGWEEGLFPHQRVLDENGVAGLEEERRLAYVGLTRARQSAHVYFAANRQMYGQWVSALPSRFVDEMPADHTEATMVTGLRAAGGQGFAGNDGLVWNRRGRQPRRGWREAPVIDGQAFAVADDRPDGGFEVGARVFHQKFGYGRVLTVEQGRLEIDFEHTGRKKVMDSFVQSA